MKCKLNANCKLNQSNRNSLISCCTLCLYSETQDLDGEETPECLGNEFSTNHYYNSVSNRNWAKTEQMLKIRDIFWEVGKDETLDDSEAAIAIETPSLRAVMRKVAKSWYPMHPG